MTSTDVKSTFEFILNPANRSPKRGAFRLVSSIDAPDTLTVIFHLKEPYARFRVNLVRSTTGIVPANAPAEFSQHPIGSGPFRFVSQSQDNVRARFRVVPDAIVRALELRKGSADLELGSLAPDIIP